MCHQWKSLKSESEQTEFFSTHGVRWTELARLKYFDLVQYTIIDPMHNFLLGLAKTQWYTRWILSNSLRASTDKTPRELDLVHRFLRKFESPLWAGRLPLRVGEPAGGSLTADEYKFAVTGPWAIIIPIVWETFLYDAHKDFEAANTRYTVKMQKILIKDFSSRLKRKGPQKNPKSKKKDKTPSDPKGLPNPPKGPPKKPPQLPRMHPDEPLNFLRFSTCLKIFMGSSINNDTIPRLYGEEEMKPNHHWAVHIGDQLEDYGPVYNFWAFLTERLNKVLKNMNSNNWTNGELEVSMMREFNRSAKMESIVSYNYFT
ncbi:hypothetical protein BDZ94DRAFT_1279853 [Collybia nuda]|uniref:Uncharacterized protein n=1 Tax=Collybia nuda TaxID=64659 RepID=A0A9P6CQ69_9AGAR|nr:hypothetical protein BDZ94DRAFT_1279853 [Collybia nuda]